ncbi:(deoxy)nucleoside triphosphate pyrophosphohydrolase [Micrococcoides hystricis]|uniref:8-oxo-dGTP diphosphatase n=1 Tax=Micrococcoides hystricis TaxID=1572761 RepID=A0ABV6P864_9MICC
MIKKIVGGAIVDSLTAPQQVLLARRTSPHQFAGMYEFPGGKVEPGETCEAALHREILEELGVQIRLGAEVPGPGEYGWPLNETAQMRVWLAEVSTGEPEPLEDHDELRWVPLEDPELLKLNWIPADLPIVEEILRTLRPSATV